MTSYDGLTTTSFTALDGTSRAVRARAMPVWLPAVAWALGLVVVVVAAAFGGALLALSSLGVVALVAGMAATAARWHRIERLAAVELAERRASAAETRLV
ncbi:hypothetical protein [Frigoribacterium sp. VKM Ac-2836]|uniref:hypothetical protein n=1 Tax=Frigoribacterium sp. VKM Ac-2836 TaxID=2739014 RepID=UPI0015675A47|nr:hypothetical protein [Frigoribacterium sp. VKM Ac-2836]NRD27559.1 hypothetical protein [Frigoribacterium sp. VKM Ac-2836]